MEILLPTSVLVVPLNPSARRHERRVAQTFALALAVFELVAPALGPHEHTFVEDTVFSALLLAAMHILLGFVGISKRLPLATALYLSFIMWALGYALLEWWLPYFFGIVSEERVVRLDHVTRDAWKFLPHLHRRSKSVIPTVRHMVAGLLYFGCFVHTVRMAVRASFTRGAKFVLVFWAALGGLCVRMWQDVTHPQLCIRCLHSYSYGPTGWKDPWCLFIVCMIQFIVSLVIGLLLLAKAEDEDAADGDGSDKDL